MRSIARGSIYCLGILMLVGSATGRLLANGPTAAPEIDGGVVSMSLAALSAGVLILRSRRRAK